LVRCVCLRFFCVGVPSTQLASLPGPADELPVPAESALATPIGAMPESSASAPSPSVPVPALGDSAASGAVQLHTTAPSWIEVRAPTVMCP
jgi:hypothetical protein